MLEILRDQREELDPLRSQYFCKRKEEDLIKLVCHRATVVELVQVSYDISSEKTLKRETTALVKAGISLKCDKLTLVTAYENRVLDVHGQVINVCAAYK